MADTIKVDSTMLGMGRIDFDETPQLPKSLTKRIIFQQPLHMGWATARKGSESYVGSRLELLSPHRPGIPGRPKPGSDQVKV